MSDLTYKELKELIKNKPEDDEVIILRIGLDDNEYFTLEKFVVDGHLTIGGIK